MADGIEKRYEPRFSASFKVKLEVLERSAEEFTDDLSRGGMFLVTRSFLPVNQVIPCVIYLPDGKSEVKIIGRVAHVMGEADAQRWKRRPGMGIEFLNIQREDAERLYRYLTRGGGRGKGATHRRKNREAELLVVDDQPAYLEQVTQALSRAGFRVRTAENGLAGLGQCLKQAPALILSNVELPQMDGWALLRMVRARATLSHIPFVFLTALGSEAERLRGFRMGVDDYVTKPYDLDELAERLDQVLARHEHNPQAAMASRALSGELDQVSLESLLLNLDAEQQSGTLLLVREGEQATLFVSEGRVIHCAVSRADLSGPEKVYYALSWTAGRFEFTPHEIPKGDEIRMTVPEMLLEHKTRLKAEPSSQT